MSIYVPKPIMFGLGYLIACAFGWMLYASVTGVAHADAPVLSGALSAPVAAAPYAPAAVSSAPAVGQTASPRTESILSSTTPTGTTYPEALEGSAISTGATGATYVPPAADQPPPALATAQISPQAPELPMSTVSPLSLVDDASFGGSVEDPATKPAPNTNPLAILEADQAPAVGPDWIQGPGIYIAPILAPLAGAQTRAVAFSEWESYRTEVVGRNILAATDDSNLFMYRDGKLNGNTGDTDASGLNVTDARNSVIRGTTSADFPPWENQSGPTDDDEEDDADDDETDTGDGEDTETGDDLTTNLTTNLTTTRVASAAPVPAAFAAVTEAPEYPFDFPYVEWVRQISGDRASAVHTDEGTTLASGQDVVVVGADGYDDDDNRAVGEHIVLTRDDCNVVVGGTGDVNAQIGDSEQGAVIMDVDNVLIEGGGAF